MRWCVSWRTNTYNVKHTRPPEVAPCRSLGFAKIIFAFLPVLFVAITCPPACNSRPRYGSHLLGPQPLGAQPADNSTHGIGDDDCQNKKDGQPTAPAGQR
jgi:hypothetical protein